MLPPTQIDDSLWSALRRVLGGNGLRDLSRALGGLEIKVPARPDALHDDHALVTALGEEQARLMVKEFAGETFYVRQENNDPSLKYAQAVDQGLSNYEISRAFGVSDRQVRHVLRSIGIRNPNVRKNSRQRAKAYQPEDETAALTAE